MASGDDAVGTPMTCDDASARAHKLIEQYHSGELSRAAYLERLRHDYHSVHASVRTLAVRLLDAMPEPERTRELTQLFVECQWRETQVAIIRVLGTRPTQRGLEFLIHLAANDADLGMCREAITALGRSQAPLAARYLATRYTTGPAVLRPYVAHALGELLDNTLVLRFLADLPEACASEQVLWIQSLVLALGELKVDACMDHLVRLLNARPHAVALSALLALGKLARDPDLLDGFTTDENHDFVEWQLRTTMRQQIVLRSHWSIEDYLEQLFDLETPLHAGLVLELNRFPAHDVREGLALFQDGNYRVRLAEVLVRLRYPEAAEWYADLLDVAHATDDELASILTALHSQTTSACEALLAQWRGRCVTSQNDMLYEAWLRACALLPAGEHVLVAFMQSEAFTTQSVTRQIIAINQFVDCALSALGDDRRLKAMVSRLETLLLHVREPEVSGRILRAFAQLRVAGTKVVGFARKHLTDADLLPSVLQFFRFCPQRQAFDWLTRLVPTTGNKPDLAASLLQALAAQPSGMLTKDAQLDEFLQGALAGHCGQEARLAALKVLARQARPALFDRVLTLLHEDDRIRVAAIVALKSFADPRATSHLVPLLRDTSESTAGRALDTLTTQPDDAARWAILDVLEAQIDDAEVVDKIVRCLMPPKQHLQRFYDRLSALVAASPQHELLDGLIQLRDRATPTPTTQHTASESPDAVTPELDQALTRRLGVFARLDERVKAALRSAELPYHYPQVFHGQVDKSTAILEYCKAVDLFLERYLGYELLLPRLRDDLAAFQNVVYRAGLHESYPHPLGVIEALGLQGLISPAALPMAKMGRVGCSILDGRMLHAQWKIFDGLRAWSAALLLFVRSTRGEGSRRSMAPIRLPNVSDRMLVDLALHLDRLQELRNPVAHRRTLVEFADIETIRNEMDDLFMVLEKIFTPRAVPAV
jgi:HEAT repeat protein